MGTIWTLLGNTQRTVNHLPLASKGDLLICLEAIPNKINIERFKILSYEELIIGSTKEILETFLKIPETTHYFIYSFSVKNDKKEITNFFESLSVDTNGNKYLPKL